MFGAIFMALVGLSLAVAGLAALAWWLWRLWAQHEEEATVQAIEIKAAPLIPEEAETPPADAEVEAPADDAETAGAVAEAAPEAAATETEMRAVEVDVEASTPEVEAPLEETAVAATAEAPEVEVDVEAPTPEVEPPVDDVPEAATAEAPETPAAQMGAEAPEAEAEEPAAPARPDDLKRIEGIGPKIASVLQAGGILTYAQLADSDPDQLRQILVESDPRLGRITKPDTWPEQASLAAAGDWDGLEELKSGLKGGRRA